MPWRMNLAEKGYTVEPKGRIVRSHTRPGLDIAINEAEVAKSPFEQDSPKRICYGDAGGRVGDG